MLVNLLKLALPNKGYRPALCSAAAQLARDRGYVALAPQAALATDLWSRTLTQLSIADMPTASISLAAASHRAGTIAVADLIARVRRVLRAPNVNASY